MVQVIFEELLNLALLSTAVSETSFNLFCSGDERLLSELLKKQGLFL